MRDVAAEAGVSLRLVQYYFESREKLLLFGLRHLADRFTASGAGDGDGRASPAIAATRPYAPRSLLRSRDCGLSLIAVRAQKYLCAPDISGRVNTGAGHYGRSRVQGRRVQRSDAASNHTKHQAGEKPVGSPLTPGMRNQTVDV